MKSARWILVYGRAEGLAFVFMLIHLYGIVAKNNVRCFGLSRGKAESTRLG